MSRPTVAEISISALESNWKTLKQVHDPNPLIPVIKANAYGHGDLKVAECLQQWGSTHCAVAMPEEAEQVRKAGYRGSILILGPIPKNDLIQIQKLNCTPVIGEKESLYDLLDIQFKGAVHIKWDTGMNRLGLKSNEILWLRDFMKQNSSLNIEAFCTHFLKSTDFGLSEGWSEKQISQFYEIEKAFPEIKQKHLFNSDSLFANYKIQKIRGSYGARPGLSLYGYTSYKSEWSQKLIPVMTLKTKIIHIIHVKKGESVSYNATWTAPKDSIIALLPIGYADGYPRSLSNKGQVFIRGQRVPLVGIVCMDYLMIDVSEITQVKIGEDVELWGKNMPLDFLAEESGTIVYEFLTSLTSRVPRVYL